MTSRQIIEQGMAIMSRNPKMDTFQNFTNLRIAARLTWEQEEMGGIEHVRFAHRNGTPIVPVGHVCHPIELLKRGYIDGKGWPQNAGKRDIKLFKWPDGNHWYATVDGTDVVGDGRTKWNTQQEAEDAANRFVRD